MSHPSRPEGAGPTPQLLAAYVDGELGPADQAAVDAWLGDHPEARADVAAQRRLAHLWQAAAPPDPGDAAWAGACERVAATLAQAPRLRADGKRLAGVVRVAAALASVAAVLVLGLGLAGLFTPRTARHVEPLPVVSADDVEVLSMEGADVGALVVGEPPVQGPLTLASADDVTVDNAGHDVQVPKPSPTEHVAANGHHHQPPPAAPMIMFPSDPSLGKAP